MDCGTRRIRSYALRAIIKNQEEIMKKVLSGIVAVAVLCLAGSVVRAQDKASGEKVYKAKCAICHGPDGKGETATGKTTKARISAPPK